ncbi:unnamed protein product [Darwinula stevensoni]|uniref:Glutamate-gated chloride channel n=1 Tax=Darwinula stevensoni TaxID=69355 RepID=A0A7R9A4U8_9CRUS|nr:unnamed protein product [Darwinula stevensoni]CAG0893264.1 unnamed protein product [Darwinula stevensoni]
MNVALSFLEQEKQILDGILGPDRYDARIRPLGLNRTEDPAVITINFFLRGITEIDDIAMDYTVQLTFREQWKDERLKFDNMGGKVKYLVLVDPKKMWMPDLFFQNEREANLHNILLPNVFVRITPDGQVLYSIRSASASSASGRPFRIHFLFLPLDVHLLSVSLLTRSRVRDGWTTEDLVLRWKDSAPVQIVKNLTIPKFTLEEYSTDRCNSVTNTGEYGCLRVNFTFKREFSHHFTQIYVPSCLLVIASWVSSWLDGKEAVARMSLGVVSLLALVVQSSFVHASLPPLSYPTAIDVWMGACMTFAFLALLESVVVTHASQSEANWLLPQTELESVPFERERPSLGSQSRWSVNQPRWNGIRWPPERVDAACRSAFPACFAFFNVVYWCYFL